MPGVSKGVRRGLPLLHCTDTLVADVEDVEVPRSPGGGRSILGLVRFTIYRCGRGWIAREREIYTVI